jgi:hypothetical protein
MWEVRRRWPSGAHAHTQGAKAVQNWRPWASFSPSWPRNFASHDAAPLQNPWWNPVWDAVVPTGLPIDFHTI